jgi:hypothetical protein
MHELTKQDLAALRKANDVYINIDAESVAMTCVKRVGWREQERDPYAEDKRYVITLDGANPYRTRGFAHPTYHNALCAILRVGDQLDIEIVADSLVNGYAKAARVEASRMDRPEMHAGGYDTLHIDACYASIWRKRNGKRVQIVHHMILDVGVCPDNPARMVRS